MDEMYKYKTFKTVLKELNAKSHGIFNWDNCLIRYVMVCTKWFW